MARGCRGQPIFADLADRDHFAHLLGEVVEQFKWTIYDWVFMPNHHHLLVGLEEENLAQGLHRAHFMFAQRWNERHESTGHVLFRRYKNVPLLRTGAALRVMRYIDLNPVRAGLCDRPELWQWGGFAANVGRRRPLSFHSPEAALSIMSPDIPDPLEARPAYARTVYDRLDLTRNRGLPSDARPSLDEILVPGDIDSIREALDTWWYSERAVAAHIGCSPQTVATWLRGSPSVRTRRALAAWTLN